MLKSHIRSTEITLQKQVSIIVDISTPVFEMHTHPCSDTVHFQWRHKDYNSLSMDSMDLTDVYYTFHLATKCNSLCLTLWGKDRSLLDRALLNN